MRFYTRMSQANRDFTKLFLGLIGCVLVLYVIGIFTIVPAAR